MNYKRHWDDKKEGLSPLFSLSNSACHTMEVDGLMLRAGNSHSGETGGMEYGFAILGGSCRISGDGFDFEHVGKRRTSSTERPMPYIFPAERRSPSPRRPTYASLSPNARPTKTSHPR